jgi:serine/threonine protein kinase
VRISGEASRAPTQPATEDSQIPRIGDVLDSRYRITGVLGSGGMGCVYLAEHVSIQRPLALKLLHPEVEEIDEVTKRFEREAFAIGRVDHPNCVNVSDFGKLDDGTFYMVLELLDGVLLSDLLERQVRLDWKRVLHIGRHVLSALDYAHGAGIIHRDIKPENVILVEQDGDSDFAKILDFGIAKLHGDAKPDSDIGLLTNDAKLTQHGVTIGTPTYIAPEQAYGQPIDGRADLYSLSIMLYEMIVGTPPFDADEVGTLLRMHVSSEVPKFAEVAPELDVPKTVEALIRHGLEKKANNRVESAKAYIDRIDEIMVLEDESQSGLRELPSRVVDGLRGTVTPAVARVVKKKRTPKQIAVAALVVAGLIGASSFVFGSKGPDYLPNGALSPLVPTEHGAEAEAAAEMLAQGRPKDAASYLMGHGKEVRDKPYAQLVLGHAQASAQRSIQALIAYENAVSLEPKLAKDKLMRTNIELMLDKKAPGVVDAAIDFLGKLVSTTGDWTAADQLVDMASSSKSPRRRHKAMSVADEVGLGDQVDRLGSYLLDLEQGETCLLRKDAVGKLRALGNKKAIPPLRKARKRIRTEGAFVKRKVNTNACLRTDAAEAIRYLQSL